ncbi:hypothetical protein C7121_29925 [Paenibacillus glucanolyticus]|uniref:hypothetical protein n=1 Tax=Paenibacillus glucanolyticus TaxID=59843 RepID=UPI000D1AF4C1|nr:hypothetical protein [Paenibacillus glucanolyticus]AVV60039.1 hypothetical protein C7121_29925 [Paenibacillus glucanolyticus]
MEDKIIYRLDDDISFRKCSLHDESKVKHGDCTNYYTKEISWKDYYFCNQDGIHLHCSKHPEIEMDIDNEYSEVGLVCPKCQKRIEIGSLKSVYSRCQKLLNIELFKDAKLIRLDDWYIPEVKEKIKPDPDYWINTNVKTDKDGNTIVVLYIGYKGSKDKVQFFIKPEKGQLSSDHKDMDPTKVLSKIVVTLKNRTLSQEYEDE